MIVAIAGSLVMGVGGDQDTVRLRGAADVLAADIGYAQSESIARGDDPRVLAIESDGSGYRIALRRTPASPLNHPIDKQPFRTTFGQGRAAQLPGVVVDQYSLGGDNLLGFGIYGQLDQATPATIRLATATKAITLTIAPSTGEVSIGQIVAR